MRLVVVSDSHGDRDILVQLQAHYQGQDVTFLHCGDSELRQDDAVFEQMTGVEGNMDWHDQFPDKVMLSIEQQRILMTHGHLYGVNFGLTNLLLAAQAEDANLIFYGHTHQLACATHEGILMLNPGSISQPRGQFQKIGGTYAVVDVSEQAYEVQYYNRDFEAVERLKFKFNR